MARAWRRRSPSCFRELLARLGVLAEGGGEMRMLPLVPSFLRYPVCLSGSCACVCVCALRRSVVVVDAERRELTPGRGGV